MKRFASARGSDRRVALCILLLAGMRVATPQRIFGQKMIRSGEPDLVALRSNFRHVLVFYPEAAGEPEGTAASKQRELLSGHEAELKERDVLVEFIPIPTDTNRPSNRHFRKLRADLQVADREFMAVLVGKDGGEKFRSHAPVTIGKLITLIDAMPMRRQEVENGHAK